jgi:hypothetical protein
MGTRVQIVEATSAHAFELAARMRAEDRAEVWASDHQTAIEALEISSRGSEFARTLLINGEPAAIWGVRAIEELDGVYVAWLLTADIVDRYPITFCRTAKAEIARILDRYPVICNMVDARYTKSLRWLGSLGFEVHDRQPLSFGPESLPFHLVVLRRKHADRTRESTETSRGETLESAQAQEEEGRIDCGGKGPVRLWHHAQDRLEAGP